MKFAYTRTLFFFICLFTFFSFPKTVDALTWAHRYAYDWMENLNDTGGVPIVERTADGGYVLFSRPAVIKLDSLGQIQWAKTMGTDGLFLTHGATTSDGGYIVVADNHNCNTIACGDLGQYYALRLDSMGQGLWRINLGSNNQTRLNWVSQNSDGGFLIVGQTKHFGAGNNDLWAVRLDQNGNVTWSRAFGGIGDDQGIAGIQTSDGGFLLSGMFSSIGPSLLKLDPLGNIEWQKNYGTPFSEKNAIIELPGQKYQVWARFTLFTIDADGNVLLAKALPLGDMRASITSDGGYVVTSNDNGSSDIWVAKLDSDLNYLWQMYYGDTVAAERGRSVVEAADGGFLISGSGEYLNWTIKTDSIGNVSSSCSFLIEPAARADFQSTSIVPADISLTVTQEVNPPVPVAAITEDKPVTLTEFCSDQDTFLMNCVPDSFVMEQGDTVQTTCALTSYNNWSGDVSLSCPSLPAGTSCSFLTNPVMLEENASNTSVATISSTSLAGGNHVAALIGDNSLDTIPFNVKLNVVSVKITPNTLEFGSVNLGETDSQNITVTNVSENAVTIVTNSPAPPFIITNACANLPPSDSCTIGVEFKPTLAGVQNQNFSIFYSPLLSRSVSLQGNGILPPLSINLASPNGGESWAYSADSVPRNEHLLAWDPETHFPVSRTKLSYSSDGITWTCIADSEGADCSSQNYSLSDTLLPASQFFLWEMPTQIEAQASGQMFPTAQARVKVEIWDNQVPANEGQGISTADFFIIQPTTTTFRTLLIWDSNRIQNLYGVGDKSALELKLQQLADHSRVQGVIRNLALPPVPSVQTALEAWDLDSTNQMLANVAAEAIRDYIRSQLVAFPNVQYLILVGDDRQIPFYRMVDGTTFYSEQFYPAEVTLNTSTTVGSAIDGGYFLTDNFYSERNAEPSGIPAPHDSVYLNDVFTSRLVETPTQMVGVINTFLEQDGQLNVTGEADEILVAGQDFLYDSALRIQNLFSPTDCLLDDPDISGGGDTCANVEYNGTDLQNELLGSSAHLIVNINDHANHFSFGASTGNLSTATMLSDMDHLRGTVLYSPGCHSGLSVPEIDENSLDLPELMAEKRVVSYIANTGYGWGLEHGVGLSEKLMELITLQIVESGSVSMGKALANAKRQYYIEERRYDVFDEKVLHTLTLYGIPNYLVVTKSETVTPVSILSAQGIEVCAKGVCLQKSHASAISPPSGLTQLNLNFQFGQQNLPGLDPDVYNLITIGSDGSYYQLNDAASGETGDTIQPHLVFDSKLSGVAANGAMFTGGQYVVIPNFNPIVAVPRSTNSNDGEGAIPGQGSARPRTRISRGGGGEALGPEALAAFEPASFNTMVADSGYFNGDSNLGTEYVFKKMDFAVFYFDSQDSSDLTPPVLTPGGDGDFHTTNGAQVDFAVTATDEGTGVHAVLITYNNPAIKRWESIELENTSGNLWIGSLDADQLGSYYVQAVDNHGNVSEHSTTTEDSYIDDTDPCDPECTLLPYGSEWSAPIIYNVSGGTDPGLFFDDFEDATANGWTLGTGWLQTGGELRATTSKKTDAKAIPAFAGCTTCAIETTMRIDTPGGVASLYGWYQTPSNMVEVMLMEAKDKLLLKQKSGGNVVAKGKHSLPVNVGVNYKIRVAYSAGLFQVFVNDAFAFDVGTGFVPFGTVGFRVKSTTGAATTGNFQEILVE